MIWASLVERFSGALGASISFSALQLSAVLAGYSAGGLEEVGWISLMFALITPVWAVAHGRVRERLANSAQPGLATLAVATLIPGWVAVTATALLAQMFLNIPERFVWFGLVMRLVDLPHFVVWGVHLRDGKTLLTSTVSWARTVSLVALVLLAGASDARAATVRWCALALILAFAVLLALLFRRSMRYDRIGLTQIDFRSVQTHYALGAGQAMLFLAPAVVRSLLSSSRGAAEVGMLGLVSYPGLLLAPFVQSLAHAQLAKAKPVVASYRASLLSSAAVSAIGSVIGVTAVVAILRPSQWFLLLLIAAAAAATYAISTYQMTFLAGWGMARETLRLGLGATFAVVIASGLLIPSFGVTGSLVSLTVYNVFRVVSYHSALVSTEPR